LINNCPGSEAIEKSITPRASRRSICMIERSIVSNGKPCIHVRYAIIAQCTTTAIAKL